MASDPFSDCLAVLFEQEGGFSNNPKDSGGITNLGVTKHNWEAWVGHAVSIDDMKALSYVKVASFYRAQFWQSTSCDKYPTPIALCVFDFAVNGGPGRAVMELQHIVGCPADGHAGTQTILAVQNFIRAIGIKTLIGDYQKARCKFYEGLPKFPVFGKGWLARIDVIKERALSWIG